MARKPPKQRQVIDMDPDGDGFSNTSISDDEGEEEEEEEEAPEDDDEDDDGEEGDDGDDDDDDDEGDDDEGEEEEGDDEDDDVLDDDTLNSIAGSNVPHRVVGDLREQNRQLLAALAARVGAPAAAAEPAVPAFDVDAKTKERNEKLLEGDTDAAAKIDKEIQKFYRDDAVNAATAAAQNAIAASQVQAAITDIQRRYPVLDDSKKKSFDPDVLDLVISQRNLYIGRGMDTATALRKAAKVVCERAGVPTKRGDDDRPAGGMTRAQKMRQVERAQRQPARLSQAGGSGRSRVDTSEGLSEETLRGMSEARFKAIDPREKARARGDFVGPKKSGTRRRSRD